MAVTLVLAGQRSIRILQRASLQSMPRQLENRSHLSAAANSSYVIFPGL